MTYEQALHYLYTRLPVFHRIGSAAYKPGLDNSFRLMKALGNPQRSYRTIHVAGTNGKGSVSHFLAAILQKAGYRTGLYTSPHLVDFGERIKVDGRMIEQAYVIDFVERHKEVFDAIEPSFFEVSMAMAFDYFHACKVDAAIIEVGLGGRLDSTNIIEPDLSVITNISFDHVGFLGDTLAKIAAEKAGIIKRNVPVVIGETLPETLPVFKAKAKEMKTPLIFAEKHYNITSSEKKTPFAGKMIVDVKHVEKNSGQLSEEQLLTIGLSGDYQLKNTATVLTAIDQLNALIKGRRFPPVPPDGEGFISEENIRSGLENVVELTGLQGRWQLLRQHPTVVADTGHNEAGIRSVVEQLNRQQYNALHIVIGMVNDKDITAVLALLPKRAVYYFTQAAIERALPAQDLFRQAQKFALKGKVYPKTSDAVKAAVSNVKENDFVFIGGSNFIVGEAIEDIAWGE
ncbi:MAG: bifunctional folylpolyglutamate synthase/dihydrofolate synthase [Prevotellaceae bacterium]|nr:bifunctional folylpolyglutamate synthase/dihydrofolate synthase [Prevotellaceae bacterium]